MPQVRLIADRRGYPGNPCCRGVRGYSMPMTGSRRSTRATTWPRLTKGVVATSPNDYRLADYSPVLASDAKSIIAEFGAQPDSRRGMTLVDRRLRRCWASLSVT